MDPKKYQRKVNAAAIKSYWGDNRTRKKDSWELERTIFEKKSIEDMRRQQVAIEQFYQSKRQISEALERQRLAKIEAERIAKENLTAHDYLSGLHDAQALIDSLNQKVVA